MSCEDPSKALCCKISNRTTSKLLAYWVWYGYFSWMIAFLTPIIIIIMSGMGHEISLQDKITCITIPVGVLIQQFTIYVVINLYERLRRIESQLNINDEDPLLNY